MRLEQLRSGLYAVYDSANKIVLANVSKETAMKYMDKRRWCKNDNKNRRK